MKKAHLILEFSEFTAQRFNPDSGLMSVGVADPTLSTNSFDRHENSIQNGMERINKILKSLSNSPTFRYLKAKFSLQDQNVSALKILRIIQADNMNYNVYINFTIAEKEYWGIIENILDTDPVFNSEVFKDMDLVQSKEWMIKIKGLLINIIKGWLSPELGKYRALKDDIICYSINKSQQMILKKDDIIEVIKCYDNIIEMRYNDELYSLMNQNYVYFNYWFYKVD